MGTLDYDNWGASEGAIQGGCSTAERENVRPRLEAARQKLLVAHDRGELEYLDLPTQDLSELRSFVANVSDRIDTVLLIGIGGSSLGPRAVFEAWGGTPTRRLIVSENIDPDHFRGEVAGLDPNATLVCVITKSGSTIETMAKFWHVWEHFGEHLEDRSRHFVAVTDPEKGPLRSMVDSLGIVSFDVPPAVGGRFSVLSHVGLVPLALAGYPVAEFLRGAGRVAAAVRDNPDGVFAICEDHFLLLEKGFSQTVVMPYVNALTGFSEWFCQLWGESLGKRFDLDGNEVRVGFTPIRALGAVDQHSQVQLYVEGPLDKHVLFITSDTFSKVAIPKTGLPDSLAHLQGKNLDDLLRAEQVGTAAALRAAGVPTSCWKLDRVDPENVGALMMAAMVTTSLVGGLMNINPYDQPGVELGKRVAHGLLGRAGFEEDAALANELESAPHAI